MKEKLIKLSKPLLLGAMALGGWIGVGFTSLYFFGEYEYPIDKSEK